MYSPGRSPSAGNLSGVSQRRFLFFLVSLNFVLNVTKIQSKNPQPYKFVFSYFSGKSRVQQSDDSSKPHMNFPRSSDMSRQRTIESLIVVEKVMTKFYGVDQIKKYVPTIINVVRERKYRVNSVA